MWAGFGEGVLCYLHYGSTLRSFQDYLGSCYKLWFLQRLEYHSASSIFLYMIKPL